MTLFERIQKEIPDGLVLKTPVVGKRFKVKSIESERLVFFVGTKTKIKVSKACWNGIPDFLKGKDWVKIGAKHGVTTKVEEGTLKISKEVHKNQDQRITGYIRGIFT